MTSSPAVSSTDAGYPSRGGRDDNLRSGHRKRASHQTRQMWANRRRRSRSLPKVRFQSGNGLLGLNLVSTFLNSTASPSGPRNCREPSNPNNPFRGTICRSGLGR